jgi:hypothetical protein
VAGSEAERATAAAIQAAAQATAKKLQPEPMILEAIIWHDAQKGTRESFTTERMLLTTVGLRLYEDAHHVVLFQELECRPDYLASQSDYTKIPKRMISYREVIGQYVFKASVPKRASRRKRMAKPEAKPDGEKTA